MKRLIIVLAASVFALQPFAQNVTIGTQVWMTKNLNVSTFRNGDPIPHAKTDAEWQKADENKQPAWCYYNNDPANGVKYGKLYNWYAVSDPRGLAPVGYHIPSDAEWTVLTDYFGGDVKAGAKMKSKHGWAEDGNGTNSSGFSGLPGGYRRYDGAFNGIGRNGYWWRSTVDYYPVPNWGGLGLHYKSENISADTFGEGKGFSVRCLLGAKPAIPSVPVSLAQQKVSGKVTQKSQKFLYNSNEVTIGTQVWMTKNLDVSTFRNGDPIPHAKTDGEWQKADENKQPAWCYYNNDPANGVKYGKLYNWYAVSDPRGLAPKGWHIPSDNEWDIITDYLGGEEKAGAKMKSKQGWANGGNSTNSSGFSGVPGGLRYFTGGFNFIGEHVAWWSSTENDTMYASFRNLYYSYGSVGRYNYAFKGQGLSVRCLRD